MAERHALPIGMTPRLLCREAAAAYCGVSPTLFEQSVEVPALRCFGSRVLWDRVALDRWLDQQSGLTFADAPPARSIAERLNGGAEEPDADQDPRR